MKRFITDEKGIWMEVRLQSDLLLFCDEYTSEEAVEISCFEGQAYVKISLSKFKKLKRFFEENKDGHNSLQRESGHHCSNNDHEVTKDTTTCPLCLCKSFYKD